MENISKNFLLSFFILCIFVGCQSANEDKPTNNNNIITEKTSSEHLLEIMKLWQGKFNNDKQIAAMEKAGKDIWRTDDSGEGGFLHIESHYIKLDNPGIGENVLYVEEYRDKKVEESYRQRIYTLAIDSTDAIKVKMWPFKDKKKYIGACNDISKLDALTKDDISAYPDKCDLLVKVVGKKYSMYMNGKDCAFGDKYFNYEVMLSENLFSYRDKIMQLSNDSLLTTAADFTFHDLDKVE